LFYKFAMQSISKFSLSRIVTIFALFFTPGFLVAQRYVTALGLRVDRGINITGQQYITNGWTIEGILHTSLRSDDLGLTVLAEKHKKILFRGINVYAGAGVHYYSESGDDRNSTNDIAKNIVGLSGIAGAEISIGRFNVSVDLKPDIHFNAVDAFDWNGPAVSLRYIIIKRQRRGIDDVFDRFRGNDRNKRKKRFWES
jgi:hypothetical protein